VTFWVKEPGAPEKSFISTERDELTGMEKDSAVFVAMSKTPICPPAAMLSAGPHLRQNAVPVLHDAGDIDTVPVVVSKLALGNPGPGLPSKSVAARVLDA